MEFGVWAHNSYDVDAAALRNAAGTVSGGNGLSTNSATSRWFRGTHGSIAGIPAQVATALRGKTFVTSKTLEAHSGRRWLETRI